MAHPKAIRPLTPSQNRNPNRNPNQRLSQNLIQSPNPNRAPRNPTRRSPRPAMPHTLGDFELSIISDGTYYLDGGAFFGVVPKVLWERRVQADEKNRITSGLNSLLIRTGDKNILVETGIGNKLNEKQTKIHGNNPKLLNNLHNAGLAPEDVDIVINSHLHFDHCGWNTIRRNEQIVPTFPKPKYYAQAGEYE